MELGLNESQNMLKKSARDFFARTYPMTRARRVVRELRGHDPELWKEMARLGWLGLPFPEQYGGSGASLLDLVILIEEMGRACLHSPFFSTVVVSGFILAETGSGDQKESLLPRICDGRLVCSLAAWEPGSRYEMEKIETRADASEKGFRLAGRKIFVSDAHHSDYLICAACTSPANRIEDSVTLFLVERGAGGVSCTPYDTLTCETHCTVELEGVETGKDKLVGIFGQGWNILRSALERAAVARCAEMVGAAGSVLDMSVAYARERVQFDRPIGSYQAIQHYCADMAVDLDASRYMTYYAAWQLSESGQYRMESSLAKAWVNEACQRVAIQGHQIHGGIGFCEDHNLHLYFRKIRGGSLSYGDTAYHNELAAKNMIAGAPVFADMQL